MMGVMTTVEHLQRERRALRALARRLLANLTEDDDVVQDAYLAAVRQGVDGPHAGRWLMGVTHRLALLHRGRDARRRRREEQAARSESTASAADVAATAEVARRVTAAVHALDEPFRTAIVLRFWQGLPPREIAKRTGVPTNTVRSRIQRGLARLRQRLDADGGGGRAGWAVPLAGIAHRGWGGAIGVASIGGLMMGTYGKVALIAVAAVLAWTLWPNRAGDAPLTGPELVAEGGGGVGASMTDDPPVDRQLVADAVAAEPTPLLVVTGTLIDEETMAPLVGGVVSLANGLERDVRPDPESPRAQSARDGTFRIATTRAGVAQHAELWIEAADRATFRHSVANADRTTNPPAVDVGRILVPPGTGLAGTVVDADGVAVANADVFVSTWSPYYTGDFHAAEILPGLLQIGTTDAAGWFSAQLRAAPFATETFVVAVADHGIGYRRADVTRHRSALEVTVRLRPSVHLDVDVRGPDDTPVTGATVCATPRFLPLGTNSDFEVSLGSHPRVLALFETTTGDDGRASLPSLPLGEGDDWGPARSYELTVEASGFRALRERIELTGERDVRTQRLVRDVPVQLNVHVVDSDRRPVKGATVSVGEGSTATDADGNGALREIEASGPTVYVRVEADGFLPFAGARPTPDGVSGVYEFVLSRATSLQGSVTDQHGEPIAGARVFVNGPQRAETGEDGTFRIDAVPTGELQVAVFPPEPQDAWAPTQVRSVRAAEAPQRWVLERLARGLATLHVEVADMVTGAPADPGGSVLHLIDERGMMAGPFVQPTERRIGHLRFDGVRPGRYKLGLAGRVERVVDVTPTDVDLRLRVELGAPGVVNGEVSFEDLPPGLVPEKVMVMFGPSSRLARWVEPPSGRLLTREPGPHVWAVELRPHIDARFRLEDVDPHQPLVLSASGSGVIGHATVLAPPGGEDHVTIRVGVAGSVRLRFQPRCPAPRIAIRFRRENEEWGPPRELHSLEGSTVASGRLPIRAGRYRWQVTWMDAVGDQHSTEGDVAVEPRQTAEVVVDFDAAGK